MSGPDQDRRLRVGVPAALLRHEQVGGHGRLWYRGLRALGEIARVRRLYGRTARLRPQPEVVLFDGHGPPPDTTLPRVAHVHEAGWLDPESRSTLDPQFVDWISAATEAGIRGADRVIVPSESARADVIRHYGVDPEHVKAVHEGVGTEFRPTAREGRTVVAELLGREAPYVLFAASLLPRKNLAVVRAAVARLAAEGLPHVLAIAGGAAPDRPDSSDLERAATAELPGAPGRIVRLPCLTDSELAGVMAQADAFCLPSLYEGFGLTVAEAMACGAPVVVSDRGSLPEVAGDAGLVVSPDVSDVTSALRRVLTDSAEAERLSRAGAARGATFTWERTARGWLESLEAAARLPRP